MKFKKFAFVLLLVAVIALVFVTPAFALDGAPPVEKPVFDMAAISQALQALIMAVAVPLAGFAARWLKSKVEYEKSLLTSQQQWALEAFIKTLVYAAEQINLRGAIVDKYQWVESRAEEWLFARNLEVNIDELRAQIEAAVAQELNMHKILPAPSAE